MHAAVRSAADCVGCLLVDVEQVTGQYLLGAVPFG